MFVNHTKKYFFIHIPKCGGTTVQETLLKHSIFLNEEFTMYEFHTSGLCAEARVYASMGYTEIVFVRDPYTRFVSAWDQIRFMTEYYNDVDCVTSELKKLNYLLPLAPMNFFTHAKTVYRLENFRSDLIKVLDAFGYPRVWWNRNQRVQKTNVKDFYEKRPDLLQFVTEFYFKDFVDFKYPMKLAVRPIIHVIPAFDAQIKYTSQDVRDKPDDIYFWAMKSVHDQEQEPKESQLVQFIGTVNSTQTM